MLDRGDERQLDDRSLRRERFGCASWDIGRDKQQDGERSAFVADLIAAQMVRIQQREVAAATGLDSQADAELASLVTAGLARAR